MPNDRPERLERLLDRLGIGEGDLVMLHTAYSRVKGFADSPTGLIDCLKQRLGPNGTLVMPRYAWNILPERRPWKGYAEFMRTLPPVDLRHSPANIGVVPDHFWRMDDVHVSTSHFWPTAACGRLATTLVASQAEVIHAYGAGSVFARLLDWDAKILGLGVTLNTSSIAPVTDLHLPETHWSRVFTDVPVPGIVIDRTGKIHRPNVTTMRPEAVRNTKPSCILAERLRPGEDFPFIVEGDSFFFSYRASVYHDAALSEAQVSLRRGLEPPWLS